MTEHTHTNSPNDQETHVSDHTTAEPERPPTYTDSSSPARTQRTVRNITNAVRAAGLGWLTVAYVACGPESQAMSLVATPATRGCPDCQVTACVESNQTLTVTQIGGAEDVEVKITESAGLCALTISSAEFTYDAAEDHFMATVDGAAACSGTWIEAWAFHAEDEQNAVDCRL